MVVSLQQSKVLDYKHSKLLLYRNMIMREADITELWWSCYSNPKCLTTSTVSF